MTKWQKFWLYVSLGAIAIIATSLVRAQTVKTPAIPGTGSQVTPNGVSGIGLIVAAGPSFYTWGKSTLYTDGTAIPATVIVTYNIYESVNGAPEVQIGAGFTITSAAIDAFPLGVIHCVTITAVAQGQEGPHTTPLCDTPPARAVTNADAAAYKRREAVGGYTWVIYGTVAVGTPCDSTHQDDGYQLVPRSAVTLNNRFDVHPLDEWAHCQ